METEFEKINKLSRCCPNFWIYYIHVPSFNKRENDFCDFFCFRVIRKQVVQTLVQFSVNLSQKNSSSCNKSDFLCDLKFFFQSRKKTSGSDSGTVVSEDWKQMFGTSDIHTDAIASSNPKKSSKQKKEGSPASQSVSRIIEIPPLGWGPYKEPGQGSEVASSMQAGQAEVNIVLP